MFTRLDLVLGGICILISPTVSINFEFEELDQDLDSFSSRQLYFNNTATYAIVALSGIGVALLIAAIGLYLYDFYGPNRRNGYEGHNYKMPPNQGHQYNRRGRR